jgi:hypothetical protein
VFENVEVAFDTTAKAIVENILSELRERVQPSALQQRK